MDVFEKKVYLKWNAVIDYCSIFRFLLQVGLMTKYGENPWLRMDYFKKKRVRRRKRF